MRLNEEILVVGGESIRQKTAHSEVEAWDAASERWKIYPSLVQGRHGSGVFLWEKYLYTCSGSGNRGGRPGADQYGTLEGEVGRSASHLAECWLGYGFCIVGRLAEATVVFFWQVSPTTPRLRGID